MSSTNSELKLLSQEEAISLDKELFDEYAFSVDQLMELAGLSVANVIARVYDKSKNKKPIICCGPGNNGGDGLVAARHLKLFGYEPIVICAKPGRGNLYQNLMTQCRKFDINILDKVPDQPLAALGDIVVDAVFGFSFKPPNRNADFAKLLKLIHESSDQIPLVSVDIPSGWHVESGYEDMERDQADIDTTLKIPALKPDCLISLTAPKLCARHFAGRFHFLGGRFCPESIQNKYNLNLPEYQSTDCIVQLSRS